MKAVKTRATEVKTRVIAVKSESSQNKDGESWNKGCDSSQNKSDTNQNNLNRMQSFPGSFLNLIRSGNTDDQKCTQKCVVFYSHPHDVLYE